MMCDHNGADMKYLLFFPTFYFLLFGCTNWKAKFYQSRVELERCINRDFDKEVTDGDIIVEFPGDVIDLPPVEPGATDTIVVVDTVQNVVIRTVYRNITVDPSPTLHFAKDSTAIWLTVYNRIENATLLQSVRIDSLKYPAKVRHHYRTIIEQGDNWTRLIIAALFGVTLGIIGMALLTLRRT